MRKRSEEEAFARGEIGVDGLATEEAPDEETLERQRVAEGLARNRAYLGRELLTWLLWRANRGGPILDLERQPVEVLVVGPMVLRGLAGETTELRLAGLMSPYSAIARRAIAGGLLVHQVRLRITHGERAYEATVDAEHFALRSARLPKELSEESDDKIAERLYLVEQLGAILEALLEEFLRVRGGRSWRSRVLPDLLAWLREE